MALASGVQTSEYTPPSGGISASAGAVIIRRSEDWNWPGGGRLLAGIGLGGLQSRECHHSGCCSGEDGGGDASGTFATGNQPRCTASGAAMIAASSTASAEWMPCNVRGALL